MKKARVIDPNYPDLLDKEFIYVGYSTYKNRKDETCAMHHLTTPDWYRFGMVRYYFGANQIEIINE